MRDFSNPIFFLLIVGLFVWSSCFPNSAGDVVGMWAVALCCVGFLVNAGVGMARLLSRRPAVAVACWSMFYLLAGGSAWVTMSPWLDSRQRGEIEQYRLLKKAWEEEGADAFCNREDEPSLLSLAAALNRTAVLERILARPEARQHEKSLSEAAHIAAERGAVQALKLLLEHGVGADDTRDGETLLGSSVLANQLPCAACLLQQGADVNKAGDGGSSPLIHAVVNDHMAMVRLLMKAGADPRRTNEEGRDALSYSRHEAMDRLLTGGDKP